MTRSSRNWPVLLLLALAACQREPATTSPATTADAPATASMTSAPAFTVEITFSPAARERLAKQNESVIVSADYFGYASAQAQAQRIPGSENPWFTLHRAQVELDAVPANAAATARFPAVTLDAKQLAWTDAPTAPQVNLNVYSGRRSSPDNVLDCTMFQDTLEVASHAPIRLSCRLIGEAAR
jgi:hypothetical protein